MQKICGIFGIKNDKQAEEKLVQGLRRLVYRGYDSWGIATTKGTHKEVGEVEQKTLGLEGDTGIAHTRWATHGGVTKENAHPHESCPDKRNLRDADSSLVNGEEPRFAVVHNGIIENHDNFRKTLEKHHFTSETDSEVIAHWLEFHQRQTKETVREGLRRLHEEAEGTYAIVVLDREEEKLYALKNKSPLLLARDNETYYFASDIYAVSKWSDQAYFLQDGDIVQIDDKPHLNMVKGEGEQGKEQQINWQTFEWTEEDPELGENDHWMEKEIREIPKALGRLIEENCPERSQKIENISEKIENSDKVIFTGSGTSYHASLLGVYYLQKAGIEAQTLIASEFENYERVTEDTTVMAVSQSGETRDVLNAIEHSKEKGADIVSITNVPHSTIERKSDLNAQIQAHQENCVAATKTFTNQLAVMMYLSKELGANVSAEGLASSLGKRMNIIRSRAMEDAGILKNEDDIYILGSGITYPLSREIALKLKEISYKHAEGMMAGELKHGTLALIEEGTPVIALNEGDMSSSIKEVESRGGEVINKEMKNIEDEGPQGDWESEELYLMRCTLYGFWLTHYIGKYNKLPIDRPRNLAKSVTVG